MTNELQTARLLDYILLPLKRRRRFRVTGASMLPTLRDGEIVLLDPNAYRRQPPRVGDIVVAKHPFEMDVKLIKRITAVTEDGRFHLQGDNPSALASTDSRSFGPVPQSTILGRLTSRFP
ncbi:MAG: nickel-type superoxide dismutase maturation protease [Anaerolineales bacterium]|nr:nickel-type superoxide dismutase maturation protease [Anaerolineales bacterium]MCA9928148.1 nickel-type superoxide dismutase maturation protease [Anaerolineales bacterium]